MASPSSPDSDPVPNLFAAMHLIGTDDATKKGVNDMDVYPMLVVPDSPDRAANVQSSSDRRPRWRRDPGVRNTGGSSTGMASADHMRRQAKLKSFISSALDAEPSSEAPEAEVESGESWPSNGSGKNAETVDLSCGNPFLDARHTRFPDRSFDTEHMLRQAKLKGFISGAVDEKPSLEVPYAKTGIGVSRALNGSGKNVETTALRCASPFADARQLRIGKLRRKSHGARESESSDSSSCAEVLAFASSLPNRLIDRPGSNALGFFDSKDAELGKRDKVRAVDMGSKMGQRCLAHNSHPAPCSTRKGNARPKFDGQVAAENADGEALPLFTWSDQDGKGLGGHSLFENNDGKALRGNSSQSRRGHNGCTFYHHDTAWDNSSREEGARKTFEGHQQGGVIDLDSEIRCNGNKGKAKLDKSPVGDAQHVKSEIQPERVCLTGKNRAVVTDVDDDTFRSIEDPGWRTTRNRTEKTPIYSLPENADYSRGYNKDSSGQAHYIPVQEWSSVNIVGDSSEATVRHHELNSTLTHVPSGSEPESTRYQRRQKLANENRKCRSLLSTVGGSSTSFFENLEYPYDQSFLPDLNSKFNRTANSQQHHTTSGPVMEVSELHSHGKRCSSLQEQNHRVDDSSARERQVESDEILARQLQEQFFHESAAFGDEETDATIAWSLQEMEDAQQATSITRHSRPHPRGTSIAHLYAQFPQSSYQNASAEVTNRARRRTIRRAVQFRRDLNNPVADRETRPNFLEAMESAFDDSTDMAMPSNFLQIGRDFNENDYEALLSLDDNNHYLGVSQSQINNLPQSVIQNNSIEEACVVCLEPPSMGDVIRHLPCLHKFHKECIDKWLRRRASCPICKSSITQA